MITTPSNSLSTTDHLEKDKHVMMNGQHNGSDEDDEHDNDDLELNGNGSDDITSTGTDMIDASKDEDEAKETEMDGSVTGDGHGSNGKESQHHTVTPDDASEKNEKATIKQEDKGASSAQIKSNNNTQGEIKTDTNINGNNAVSAPVPLLKGILTYIDNELTKKHTISGNWQFESSTEFSTQRFDLTRNLGPDEDPQDLPKDGEFQGSFAVMYTQEKNGKIKTRTRVIQETGVKLAFTKRPGEDDAFDVKGKGENPFGVFSIYGTAVRDQLDKMKAYKVELRKKYDTITPTPAASSSVQMSSEKKDKSKKRKLETLAVVENVDEPLPDPLESFASNVVCLRGKVARDSTVQDGVVHNITGLWSTGLDLILSDPKNEHGFCSEFEYEHRSTVDTDVFPVSGRYTGWFNLTEDGKKTRCTERDVQLKFKKNNAGYYNVEGKGTNMFGKYNITGTLNKENVITLFRHFVPLKTKKPSAPSATSSEVKIQPDSFPRMTLDDVEVPNQSSYEPVVAPVDGLYQAVSRGTFKVNENGAHTCSGQWAQSKSHHTSNITNNFNFGLEEHDAKQAIEDMKRKGLAEIKFPVDSANYKGSFRMKKGTTPIIDQQIVMKFRKNTTGGYNVYGKGVNAYGSFDLTGTLVPLGPLSGSVELFRIYAPAPEVVALPPQSQTKAKALPLAKNAPTVKKYAEKQKSQTLPSLPAAGLIRRESSRQPKVPLYLADDDPEALKARMMEKCTIILKQIQEKDASSGSLFLEPVDPVAHNIPLYHQIITNPMDLGTIQAKMEADEIDSVEDFARLVRLVFENAVKFNSNPMDFVHQTARDYLALFNQKFRDVERMLETKKLSKKERRKQQKEEKTRAEKDKKRKREEDVNPKLKQLSLLQASASDVGKALEALDAATSAGILQSPIQVSRNEFYVMTNVIRLMQTQMTHVQSLFQQLTATETSTTSIYDTSLTSSFTSGHDGSSAKKHRKGKKSQKPPTEEPIFEPVGHVVSEVLPPTSEALTHEEQLELTEAIDRLPQVKLDIMIDIIKKRMNMTNVPDDELEIDMDAIDDATQRILLTFVRKHLPKSKGAKKHQKKKKNSGFQSAQPDTSQKVTKTNASTDDSVFKFGSYDSDSDDDDEDEGPIQPTTNANTSGFTINENSPMDEDEDEDEDDDIDDHAPDWTNLAKTVDPSPENNGDGSENEDDDAWEAARGTAAALKEHEKEKKEKEEKMLQEQRIAKEKSLAEAAEKNKKLQAERKAKEEEEARKRDQKEKEEKERAQKAKDAIMNDVMNTEQTIDMDSQQRIMGDLMDKFREQIADQDLAGGASPNSDFGF